MFSSRSKSRTRNKQKKKEPVTRETGKHVREPKGKGISASSGENAQSKGWTVTSMLSNSNEQLKCSRRTKISRKVKNKSVQNGFLISENQDGEENFPLGSDTAGTSVIAKHRSPQNDRQIQSRRKKKKSSNPLTNNECGAGYNNQLDQRKVKCDSISTTLKKKMSKIMRSSSRQEKRAVNLGEKACRTRTKDKDRSRAIKGIKRKLVHEHHSDEDIGEHLTQENASQKSCAKNKNSNPKSSSSRKQAKSKNPSSTCSSKNSSSTCSSKNSSSTCSSKNSSSTCFSKNPSSTCSSKNSSSTCSSKNSSSTCSSKNSSSTCSSTAQLTNCIDIPGFFYDKHKKKYFRILPSHKNANSGIVTRETVKFMLSEEQRQKDLELLGAATVKSFIQTLPAADKETYSRTCAHNASVKLLRGKSPNILHHLNGISMGEMNRSQAICSLKRNRIMALKLQENVILQDEYVPHSPYTIGDLVKVIVSESGSVMCLCSMLDNLSQRLRKFEFRSVKRVDESGTVKIKVTASQEAIYFGSKSASHIIWAPMTPNCIADNKLLALLNPHGFGRRESVACLYDIAGSHQSYNLGREIAWTGAWDPHSPCFSVGRETNSVVLDVTTRRLWEVYSNKSHVYAQAFSHKGGELLYSGTKRGERFTHDLRSSSVRPVSSTRHKSGICHLYVSQDDRYITVAELDGKLRRIDLRQNRIVMEYKGHMNTYHRIPFTVDREEDYLCAVGMDCYTRLWDYQTGALLHALPAPYPAQDSTTIPTAAYVDNLNLFPANSLCPLPGLIIGFKDTLQFYTF